MKAIRDFEEYLEEGIIIKRTPDVQRAQHLLVESARKYRLLHKNIDALGIDDENANDYVEYCYNILMFMIRSKMLKAGFSSSGKGAHEAEVAYSARLHFPEADIRFLDKLRYFRNGILYYGKQFDKEYALKVIRFTDKKYKELSDRQ